jgi:hypothetical protein
MSVRTLKPTTTFESMSQSRIKSNSKAQLPTAVFVAADLASLFAQIPQTSLQPQTNPFTEFLFLMSNAAAIDSLGSQVIPA